MAEWMDTALGIVATLVLATIALGLVRIERGPSNGDRMLAAQLLGTGAVAVLLLLARATHTPALLDVALVLALLASVANAVFVLRIGVSLPQSPPAASMGTDPAPDKDTAQGTRA